MRLSFGTEETRLKIEDAEADANLQSVIFNLQSPDAAGFR
jgi:hypothetical protein